jgi:hypothetical protein
VSRFFLIISKYGHIPDDQNVMNTSVWTNGVRFLTGAMKGFSSLRHRVQTGSGVHPDSFPMDIEGLYCGVKGTGA